MTEAPEIDGIVGDVHHQTLSELLAPMPCSSCKGPISAGKCYQFYRYSWDLLESQDEGVQVEYPEQLGDGDLPPGWMCKRCGKLYHKLVGYESEGGYGYYCEQIDVYADQRELTKLHKEWVADNEARELEESLGPRQAELFG